MRKIHFIAFSALLAAGLLSCSHKQEQTADTAQAEIYDDSTTIIVSVDSTSLTSDSATAPTDSTK